MPNSRRFRPAAHSIFKNPREMDENACPPLAERIGGGAGAEGAPAGASERVSTKSNRTTSYKATSRAERANISIHSGNRFEQRLECTQESKGSRFCRFFRG